MATVKATPGGGYQEVTSSPSGTTTTTYIPSSSGYFVEKTKSGSLFSTPVTETRVSKPKQKTQTIDVSETEQIQIASEQEPTPMQTSAPQAISGGERIAQMQQQRPQQYYRESQRDIGVEELGIRMQPRTLEKKDIIISPAGFKKLKKKEEAEANALFQTIPGEILPRPRVTEFAERKAEPVGLAVKEVAKTLGLDQYPFQKGSSEVPAVFAQSAVAGVAGIVEAPIRAGEVGAEFILRPKEAAESVGGMFDTKTSQVKFAGGLVGGLIGASALGKVFGRIAPKSEIEYSKSDVFISPELEKGFGQAVIKSGEKSTTADFVFSYSDIGDDVTRIITRFKGEGLKGKAVSLVEKSQAALPEEQIYRSLSVSTAEKNIISNKINVNKILSGTESSIENIYGIEYSTPQPEIISGRVVSVVEKNIYKTFGTGRTFEQPKKLVGIGKTDISFKGLRPGYVDVRTITAPSDNIKPLIPINENKILGLTKSTGSSQIGATAGKNVLDQLSKQVTKFSDTTSFTVGGAIPGNVPKQIMREEELVLEFNPVPSQMKSTGLTTLLFSESENRLSNKQIQNQFSASNIIQKTAQKQLTKLTQEEKQILGIKPTQIQEQLTGSIFKMPTEQITKFKQSQKQKQVFPTQPIFKAQKTIVAPLSFPDAPVIPPQLPLLSSQQTVRMPSKIYSLRYSVKKRGIADPLKLLGVSMPRKRKSRRRRRR